MFYGDMARIYRVEHGLTTPAEQRAYDQQAGEIAAALSGVGRALRAPFGAGLRWILRGRAQVKPVRLHQGVSRLSSISERGR